VQDFVHVEDVASALVALLASDGPSGIFNVGSGEPTSIAHIANRAADYYGRARPFDVVRNASGFWADTTKIRAVTGWHRRIGIDEGIAKTLAMLDGRR
jgi:GDP-L-fucose synthase